MKIRLGYACVSETLNITSSTPYSYTSFQKEKDFDKLDKIIKSNLSYLYEILKYNNKNNIHFFRLSSALIPLATLKEVEFDYINNYKDYYEILSEFIKNNNMRVDFHPDQFCVLNSVRKEVVENSFEILKYHYNILNILNIKNKTLVLHIGGNAFGKEKSIQRFIYHFKELDEDIRNCIAIENDDKIFNILDCLNISNKINIPIVLDYHHHYCNNDITRLDIDVLARICTVLNCEISDLLEFVPPKKEAE